MKSSGMPHPQPQGVELTVDDVNNVHLVAAIGFPRLRSNFKSVPTLRAPNAVRFLLKVTEWRPGSQLPAGALVNQRGVRVERVLPAAQEATALWQAAQVAPRTETRLTSSECALT